MDLDQTVQERIRENLMEDELARRDERLRKLYITNYSDFLRLQKRDKIDRKDFQFGLQHLHFKDKYFPYNQVKRDKVREGVEAHEAKNLPYKVDLEKRLIEYDKLLRVAEFKNELQSAEQLKEEMRQQQLYQLRTNNTEYQSNLSSPKSQELTLFNLRQMQSVYETSVSDQIKAKQVEINGQQKKITQLYSSTKSFIRRYDLTQK